MPVGRIVTYVAFVAAYWGPLYLLVQVHSIPIEQALIGASIGVVPFVLLFVPLFEHLAGRLSTIKVAGVELELKDAINESVSSTANELVSMVTVAVGQGGGELLPKSGLDRFVRQVGRYLPQPDKRLVMRIDLRDGMEVDLRMLYFQAQLYRRLFDFRSLVFVDSRHGKSEILGTIAPDMLFRCLEDYSHGLFSEAMAQALRGHWATHAHADLGARIEATWHDFAERLGLEAPTETRLTDELFRSLFAPHLECNLIEYPLTEQDYLTLAGYLAVPKHSLVLVQDGKIVNVRTVDRVAREMARNLIEVAMQQRGNKP